MTQIIMTDIPKAVDQDPSSENSAMKLMRTISKELIISFPPGLVTTLTSKDLPSASFTKLSEGAITAKVSQLLWETTPSGMQGTSVFDSNEKWIGSVRPDSFSLTRIEGKASEDEPVQISGFLPDPDKKIEGFLTAVTRSGQRVVHQSRLFVDQAHQKG